MSKVLITLQPMTLHMQWSRVAMAKADFRLLCLRIRQIKSPFVEEEHLREAVIHGHVCPHCRSASTRTGIKSFKPRIFKQINIRSYRHLEITPKILVFQNTKEFLD